MEEKKESVEVTLDIDLSETEEESEIAKCLGMDSSALAEEIVAMVKQMTQPTQSEE